MTEPHAADTAPTWKKVARPKGDHITIHLGSACRDNVGSGTGGFTAILQRVNDVGETVKRRVVSGREAFTTNQRMELRAALAGLRALKGSSLPVVLVTNNQYILAGMAGDLQRWKADGWRKSGGGPISNVDLWIELDAAVAGREVLGVWSPQTSSDPIRAEANSRARDEARR